MQFVNTLLVQGRQSQFQVAPHLLVVLIRMFNALVTLTSICTIRMALLSEPMTMDADPLRTAPNWFTALLVHVRYTKYERVVPVVVHVLLPSAF